MYTVCHHPACNTVRMTAFTILPGDDISLAELLSLYGSTGWSAYTRQPEVLSAAIGNSSLVVTARAADGELVGLARAISDDATICYVQDILVRPSFRRTGAGTALLAAVQARYRHVRQLVLITDDEAGQRAFYESVGLTEGSDFQPKPVRLFARFH